MLPQLGREAKQIRIRLVRPRASSKAILPLHELAEREGIEPTLALNRLIIQYVSLPCQGADTNHANRIVMSNN